LSTVLADSGLIKVVPGLMVWTLIAFAITFFVLKKYAFGPIQKTIDDRRDRILQAVAEADNARDEARDLLEQHRQLIVNAKSESAEILAEARKVADAQIARAKEEAEAERQRRLEDTRKQRGRQPGHRGDAEGRREGARLRRPAAADRRGDLRSRLHSDFPTMSACGDNGVAPWREIAVNWAAPLVVRGPVDDSDTSRGATQSQGEAHSVAISPRLLRSGSPTTLIGGK
jgi:F0F1-type ATP synthase membrane subunit b/b'